MTGGLGPTQDDLTVDVIAKVLASWLRLMKSLGKILERYPQLIKAEVSNRRRPCPVGAEQLENALGTAPILKMKIKNCVLFPGCTKGVQMGSHKLYYTLAWATP